MLWLIMYWNGDYRGLHSDGSPEPCEVQGCHAPYIVRGGIHFV